MNWNSFDDTYSLENKLLLHIASSLRISIKENNEALVLLSIGLNSISLYKRFSEIKKLIGQKLNLDWLMRDGLVIIIRIVIFVLFQKLLEMK